MSGMSASPATDCIRRASSPRNARSTMGGRVMFGISVGSIPVILPPPTEVVLQDYVLKLNTRSSAESGDGRQGPTQVPSYADPPDMYNAHYSLITAYGRAALAIDARC